jgi:cell wall-associated NlpC family hydrolase
MRAALRLTTAASFLAALLAGGCASVPPPRAPSPPLPELQPPPPQLPAPSAQGAAIARAAALMIGAPYHFGGADAGGFDCSGLALYAHETVGLAIPRTALEQQRAARPVPLAELSPGDLVFFRIRSRHVDHVGIYAGDGRFIHAPHRGLAVSYADLSHGFYAQHLVSAGRFWQARYAAQ